MIMRSRVPPNVIDERVTKTQRRFRMRPADDLIREADILDKNMPLKRQPSKKLDDPMKVC